MRWLSRHHVHDEAGRLAALIGLAVVLWLAAGVGMCYVAGFGAVQDRLAAFQWPWLIGIVGGLAVAFVGYYSAYRGIERVEGGPKLDAARRVEHRAERGLEEPRQPAEDELRQLVAVDPPRV